MLGLGLVVVELGAGAVGLVVPVELGLGAVSLLLGKPMFEVVLEGLALLLAELVPLVVEDPDEGPGLMPSPPLFDVLPDWLWSPANDPCCPLSSSPEALQCTTPSEAPRTAMIHALCLMVQPPADRFKSRCVRKPPASDAKPNGRSRSLCKQPARPYGTRASEEVNNISLTKRSV
jgi:hypothetical protein